MTDATCVPCPLPSTWLYQSSKSQDRDMVNQNLSTYAELSTLSPQEARPSKSTYNKMKDVDECCITNRPVAHMI